VTKNNLEINLKINILINFFLVTTYLER